MIETLTGKKIKEFRLDNNIDDKLDPFMNLCWDVGIVRHFTIRVTPQLKAGGKAHETHFARENSMYII